jgi:endoglucanase
MGRGLALVGLMVAIAGGLAAIGSSPTAQSATTTAFVRVNQVGYPATAAKRAYLMSDADQTGTPFSVKNAAGTVVFSGKAGGSLGSWSRTYPFVHPLDFDAASTAGTYTIDAAGSTSPSFRIDTGQKVYGGGLANALAFYQTERDGPNYVPNALRTAPAHLNDQNAMTYLTPNVSPSGHFSGDLQPLGLRMNAAGG